MEKTGKIHVISDLNNPTNGSFLDLADGVNARPNETFLTSSEKGLLGLVSHPADDGRIFVVYNARVGSVSYQRLSQIQASGTTADFGTEKVFIQERNDAGNHNGGDIHFGADGYLYR